MFTHEFKCPHCGRTIKYKMTSASMAVECEKCHKKYAVSKHMLLQVLEIIILLALVYVLVYLVFESFFDLNYYVELILAIAIVLVLNVFLDVFIDKVLKIKKFYTLVERYDSSTSKPRRK